MTAQQIEADEVYVEYANIRHLSGYEMIIGPECEIDEIEYSGSLTIDETSTVKNQIKR